MLMKKINKKNFCFLIKVTDLSNHRSMSTRVAEHLSPSICVALSRIGSRRVRLNHYDSNCWFNCNVFTQESLLHGGRDMDKKVSVSVQTYNYFGNVLSL